MGVGFSEIAKSELIRASDDVDHGGLHNVANILTDHNVGNLTEEMGERGQSRLAVQDILQSPRITVVTTDRFLVFSHLYLSWKSCSHCLIPLEGVGNIS